MAKDSQTGKDIKTPRAPYALKRTVHKFEHGGQEYIVDNVLEIMSQGYKVSQAVKIAFPNVPKESYPALTTKIKKHPYFVAYKEASLKLLTDKGAALQQNMLDLAFNSRSDMVKFSATKDAMDRIFGEAGAEPTDDKPSMVFNFSFGGQQPATVRVDPSTIIEGETA